MITPSKRKRLIKSIERLAAVKIPGYTAIVKYEVNQHSKKIKVVLEPRTLQRVNDYIKNRQLD